MRKLTLGKMLEHIKTKETHGEDIILEIVLMHTNDVERSEDLKRYYRHVMKPRDPYLAPYRRDNLVMFGRVARPAI